MSYKLRDKVWVRVPVWSREIQQSTETWRKGRVVGVSPVDYLVRVSGYGIRRRGDDGLRAR